MWIAGSLAWGLATGAEATSVMRQLLASTEHHQHTSPVTHWELQVVHSEGGSTRLKPVNKVNTALLPGPGMGIVVPRLFQETDSFFWWVMGKKYSRGYSWTKCDKIKPSLYEDDSFAIFPSLQGCVYLCAGRQLLAALSEPLSFSSIRGARGGSGKSGHCSN